MANCPICSGVLLRHFRTGQMYWFCRRCRTEVLQTNGSQNINLSTPIEYRVCGAQANIHASESASAPLAVHNDSQIN
jgi:ribosomal protein L37AE/L43A